MDKKRILVIGQHYWPENFRITDICEGFVENDIEVDVLCGLPNYPAGKLFAGYSYFKPRKQQHNGVDIYRCGEILRKGNTSIRIFLNYISFPITATFNLFRLWGKKYDAVFSYQTSPVMMIFPAILYSKITKTPLSVYVLDLWPENLYSVLNLQSPFLRKICKAVSHWHYRRADKLITMSSELEKILFDITKKTQDKIFCIPHFCESLYEEKVYDAELSARFKDKFTVLFAGNFSPAQGLDILSDAAKKLKKDNITDIHFVMVGDGMSHSDFIKNCEQENVLEYFTFEGQKPIGDIPRYQTMADVLFAGLSASDFIGLTIPAKVTGYIAAAKPILLSMDGAAPNLVTSAQCGFCATAGDSDAFYDILLKMYKLSDAERAKLGENGLSYHNQYLKREKVLKTLISAILE